MDIQAVIQEPIIRKDAKQVPLIDRQEIKAILELAIRGKIKLPTEKHIVDISA